MSFDSTITLCVLYFLPFLAFIGLLFFFQRWRWRRRKRQGKRRLGFYPSSAAVGNALHALQALMEPQIEHILEQKLDEHAEDDDSGDPDDPVAHLHRQAARIRRGELLDRITARLRSGE